MASTDPRTRTSRWSMWAMVIAMACTIISQSLHLMDGGARPSLSIAVIVASSGVLVACLVLLARSRGGRDD